MAERVLISGRWWTIPNYGKQFQGYIADNTNPSDSITPGGYTYVYEYDTQSADITVELDPNEFELNTPYNFKKIATENELILQPVSGYLLDGELSLELTTNYDSLTVYWNGSYFYSE